MKLNIILLSLPPPLSTSHIDSDATDGLEEGELLSDEGGGGREGQLTGQEMLDPILGTSVPKRPRVKSRLRSVASTVQVGLLLT